jgi:hypothetical protein
MLARSALSLALGTALAIPLGLSTRGAHAAAAVSAACPPEATPSLRNVPASLAWGNRATISVEEPSDTTITHLRVAWSDTGRVFAEADRVFDFWIEAQHPDTMFSFTVSWTATYLNQQFEQHTCSGTLDPVTVRSGLDRRLKINNSFAGVKLNEPEARVRRVLGPPSRVTRPYSILRVYSYRRWKLQVWLYSAGSGWRVQSVRIASPMFRTTRGVGVGSSFRTLAKRHTGFTCFLKGPSVFQMCLARRLAPRPSTIFQGTRGRITRSVLTLMGD